MVFYQQFWEVSKSTFFFALVILLTKLKPSLRGYRKMKRAKLSVQGCYALFASLWILMVDYCIDELLCVCVCVYFGCWAFFLGPRVWSVCNQTEMMAYSFSACSMVQSTGCVLFRNVLHTCCNSLFCSTVICAFIHHHCIISPICNKILFYQEINVLINCEMFV